MNSQIMGEIGFIVIERNAVILQKTVNVDAAFKPQHSAKLALSEDTRTIPLDSNRFERMPGNITPAGFQAIRDVFGKLDRYVHTSVYPRIRLRPRPDLPQTVVNPKLRQLLLRTILR